ncbi:MAG: protein-disulfide reductase, partial [Rhodoferax sp.]|nr:protein-disulfide reductase [Rhodoferax sp.]
MNPLPVSFEFRFALRLATICLVLLTLGSSALAQFAKPTASSSSAVVQTEQVRAELVAFAPDGVGAGKTVWLGLQMAHQPQWHTYWKNAGDSGLPTRLEWTLPAGVTAGDIAWPTPQKINIGSLSNFGYEGTVLLPVPLTISPTFAPGALADNMEVRLAASWLVCKQECVPQDGSFVLQLPLRGSTALHAADFEKARAAEPVAHQGKAAVQVDNNGVTLTVQGLPNAWRGKNISAFIEAPEIIETNRAPSPTDGAPQTWQADGSWTSSMALSGLRSEAPTRLAFVLALDGRSVRAEADVRGAWPAINTGPAGTSAAPVLNTSLSNPSTPAPLQDTGPGAFALA